MLMRAYIFSTDPVFDMSTCIYIYTDFEYRTSYPRRRPDPLVAVKQDVDSVILTGGATIHHFSGALVWGDLESGVGRYRSKSTMIIDTFNRNSVCAVLCWSASLHHGNFLRTLRVQFSCHTYRWLVGVESKPGRGCTVVVAEHLRTLVQILLLKILLGVWSLFGEMFIFLVERMSYQLDLSVIGISHSTAPMTRCHHTRFVPNGMS